MDPMGLNDWHHFPNRFCCCLPGLSRLVANCVTHGVSFAMDVSDTDVSETSETSDTSWMVEVGGCHRDGSPIVNWAMKKRALGCLGGIGDDILPKFMGIFLKSQYKDPYKPTSISWKVGGFFFRCSIVFSNLSIRVSLILGRVYRIDIYTIYNVYIV